MVSSRWRVPEEELGAEDALAGGIPGSPLLASLLRRRGVDGLEAAERFLRPKLTHLHDPFDLPQMHAAVDRIEKAVRQREAIAVFGDYDVDGISSTCLLHDFFRFIEHPVVYRLPNRLLNGYGLRPESVRQLAAEGTKLIITVDNGSSASDALELARDLRVDVVITDHHQPPPVLPPAAAHVNPWLPESRYPFRHLAGVGVTFKLIWALSQRLSRQKKLTEEFRAFLLESLGLVALGTISDVVPLLGENRVLAKFGLMTLERTRRPGLRRLVDAALAGDGRKLEASHIGYRLGPRINAAGRMGRAETAIELLLADDETVARDLAEALEVDNRRRKEIEEAMFRTARDLVVRDIDLEIARAIVLGQEGWHPGVIGIVAARLAEEFSRPTLLFALDGGRARGSARSVPGVHILNALSLCREHLVGFGGHEMAAGVEMEPALISRLKDALNAVIPLAPSEMEREVDVEARVRLGDLTLDLLDELMLLEPHGHGNPEPLFVIEGAAVVGRPRVLGAAGRHLAFHIKQEGAVRRAVAFHQGDILPQIERPGAHVSVLCVPKVSRWQGRTEVELHVREIRPGGC